MQQRPRLAVLGLDGLPLALARTLAASGRLPNLAGLCQSPFAREIDAELPELSPVNWTSFSTAAGPGRHGIFGFTEIDQATYTLSMIDATAVACPTIFDRLGARGLTSKVVNLPAAFPARPLRGAMIAGFVAPNLPRAVYPPELAQLLAKTGYLLEADTTRGAADPDHLLSQLRATLKSRETALDILFAGGDFDLFVLVLTETDRILHFFYPALADASHPLHGPFLDLLALWDRLIGKYLELYHDLPEPKRLMVLADHGFAALRTEVDLNVWLAGQGLLALEKHPTNEWDSRIAAHGSAAFALDPGRIYLHKKERFARGTLHEHAATALGERLRQDLMAIRFEGEPVMEAVHLARDLHPGPMLGRAPDLVCVAKPGFCLTGKFNRTEMFGHFGRSGCHAAHGGFHYDSTGATPGRLRDVGREILAFFDIPQTDDSPAWTLKTT
ncbi:alkaline phosphatase family protein [Desulfolutivibrio sulfoxidireducens]|uniref:alkaline phosphatase family protein n=1 Tax=Desulfolutivibrio sulfoxidireducens TaxID=2773299 RepID=UPI00159E2097|nr:alkaline phosphatase family protein [Desulfolutivibrio sulfoxidireducens]QLA17288.1 phosphodiesterase [Desulfolutivibrio sulfoxidireducens]